MSFPTASYLASLSTGPFTGQVVHPVSCERSSIAREEEYERQQEMQEGAQTLLSLSSSSNNNNNKSARSSSPSSPSTAQSWHPPNLATHNNPPPHTTCPSDPVVREPNRELKRKRDGVEQGVPSKVPKCGSSGLEVLASMCPLMVLADACEAEWEAREARFAAGVLVSLSGREGAKGKRVAQAEEGVRAVVAAGGEPTPPMSRPGSSTEGEEEERWKREAARKEVHKMEEFERKMRVLTKLYPQDEGWRKQMVTMKRFSHMEELEMEVCTCGGEVCEAAKARLEGEGL